MGRFCILCGSIRPNEAFGGKGERAHTCRKCRRMPRAERDAAKHEREIRDFLAQSHISTKNIARLRALASASETRIADLAALVLEVAIVTPYRRHRTRTLARQQRELLTRMEQTGLIFPLPAWDEVDPHDIDPGAAWHD